ncbi:hypothetical protein SBA2_770013 [Acidobacteriia bacterium SbA2]|nr:hypothetical protein SBA2_770013 [Acidobacteriia bacterium SbA2]
MEGRGFSPAVRTLAHHFVVPPLPQAGEGWGERELQVTAGLKPNTVHLSKYAVYCSH